MVLPIEALVVGAFARRGRSPLLGGFIVWTAVAATLLAVPSLYGFGYLRQTILPVALQVVVSGLVAVVVADLIATGASAQRLVVAGDERPARRLRGDAFHAFVLAATLPVLVLASVDGQLTAAKQEADGGARLHEAVTALNEHIGAYVSDHEHAVQSLAAALHRAAARQPRAQQALLDHYHDDLPGLHHALRRRSTSAWYARSYPPRDSETPPISDREYFIDAVRTGSWRSPTSSSAGCRTCRSSRIAVPIFDARRRRRRRRRRIARSVEVRAVRRGLPHAARRAHHRRRSARPRDLTRAARPASPRCRASAQDELVLAQRRSAGNGVFRYQRQMDGRQRVAAPRRVGGHGADRLEGLRRAAAASTSGCSRPATTRSPWD